MENLAGLVTILALKSFLRIGILGKIRGPSELMFGTIKIGVSSLNYFLRSNF